MRYFFYIFFLLILVFIYRVYRNLPDDSSVSLPSPSIQKTLIHHKMVTLPSLPKLSKDPTKVVTLNTPSKSDPELDELFVKELYKLLLQREISSEELFKWSNILAQGGKREGIYHGLILGDSYRELEDGQSRPSEAFLTFMHTQHSVYLNQTLSMERLKESNSYYLKHYLAEQALEMMDVLYQSSPKHFARWYGVLSSDLASRFKMPPLFGRARKEREFHYQWALKENFDWMKMEMVLRLYIVMNQL